MFADIPEGHPAMARLLERFQQEAASRGGVGRHDPRIVVACLSAAAAGYALLGDYIRHGAGLEGHPDEEVEAMLVEVLRDVARSALRP